MIDFNNGEFKSDLQNYYEVMIDTHRGVVYRGVVFGRNMEMAKDTVMDSEELGLIYEEDEIWIKYIGKTKEKI